MSAASHDLDERLARIAASLSELRAVSADAREEVLVATEQLIQRALAQNAGAVADGLKALAESHARRHATTSSIPTANDEKSRLK